MPVYFIIGGWGHERRNHAAMKFFIYTFTGSAFMLVGILALVFIHQGQTGVTTFDIRQLAQTHLSGAAGVLLLLAFTAAFAVKAPIFPFHTWSPDAYRGGPGRRVRPAGRRSPRSSAPTASSGSTSACSRTRSSSWRRCSSRSA